jgi:DNA-directed RNA polymerase subunit K/omega
MADNKLLQQMLEHLVNDDQAKAEELFHEYVVTASREIYESLIDSEIAEEEEKE